MSLDDICWSMLEFVHLDGFFDDHRIPPILFPIIVIALIILLLLMLGVAGGGTSVCGNHVCESGETERCPGDCAAAGGKDVRVEVVGEIMAAIEIRLEDAASRVILSDQGLKNELVVKGVKPDSVIAIVENHANGRTADSGIIDLEKGSNLISIYLPPNFFSMASDMQAGKGIIKVTLKDAATGSTVTGTVGISISNGGSRIPVTSEQISGSKSFALEGNQFYQIVVSAPGYIEYIRAPERLSVGQTIDAVVLLQALGASQLQNWNATLKVCVKDQDGLAVTGAIEIIDILGEELDSAVLMEDGCASMNLSAGLTVTASTENLPAGCVGTHSNDVLLASGEQEISLTVFCSQSGNEVGHIRARVLGTNGTVLTTESTVTAWYAPENVQIPGNGYADSLEEGTGGYTESITVSTGKLVYFIVAGVPGYGTKHSSNYTVNPSENKSVDITLSPSEYCGNNIRVSPETCDGSDDAACPGRCIVPGQLNECTCQPVVTPPQNVCGNDIVEQYEVCDGTNASACPGQCRTNCTCPPVASQSCGNNLREGSEVCDGGDDTACPDICIAAGQTGACTCPIWSTRQLPDNPNCNTREGDVNNDGIINLEDMTELSSIVSIIESTCTPRFGTGNTACADVDKDGYITEYDYICLASFLTDATDWDSAVDCAGCPAAMMAFGTSTTYFSGYERYSPAFEICNDGLDNNCDGAPDCDPRCVCDSTTPCFMVKDLDSVSDTEDFAICRSYGVTDFNSMTTTWDAYAWRDNATQEAHECSANAPASWGWTERCSTAENWTSCLFKFPQNFTAPDTAADGGYIGSVDARAYAGPLARYVNCGGCPGCPGGWVEVGSSNGGECNCQWEDDSQLIPGGPVTNPMSCGPAEDGFGQTCGCHGGQTRMKPTGCDPDTDDPCDEIECVCSEVCRAYCRYEYDPCSQYGGGQVTCGPSDSGRTEVCPAKISCMGLLSDFP